MHSFMLQSSTQEKKKNINAIAYRIPMAFDDLQLDAFLFK